MNARDNRADSLRGIAALNVTLAHFVSGFLPSYMHNNYGPPFPDEKSVSTFVSVATTPFVSIIYNGHFAVWVLFVLSGYVLSMPFYRGDFDTIKARIWARYLRLNIPIFCAVLLSFALWNEGLYFNQSVSQLSGSHWFSGFFLGTPDFAGAAKDAVVRGVILGSGIFIPPLWTLGIEFIGSLYLLCFLLVAPQHKRFITGSIFAILIIAIHREQALYYLGMLSGAYLNQFKVRKALGRVLFCAGLYGGAFQYDSILYSFITQPTSEWMSHDSIKNIFNGAGAWFLVAALKSGLFSRALNSLPLVLLGRISYSLYLMHFPILCSITSWMYVELGSEFLLPIFLSYILICLIVSTGFYYSIDRFAMSFSTRFGRWLIAR